MCIFNKAKRYFNRKKWQMQDISEAVGFDPYQTDGFQLIAVTRHGKTRRVITASEMKWITRCVKIVLVLSRIWR